MLLLEFVVIWCCVVRGAWCCMCGIEGGAHVMPVVAGMAGLLFTGLLKEVIYLVWSCS